MSEIAHSNRQITFFYSSDSIRAKKALAYAKAEGYPIRAIDILKTKLTGTQLLELANSLNTQIEELVNPDHPMYKTQFVKHDFSETDWIKMIQNHPEILKQPIAMRGEKSVLVETPTDILKLS